MTKANVGRWRPFFRFLFFFAAATIVGMTTTVTEEFVYFLFSYLLIRICTLLNVGHHIHMNCHVLGYECDDVAVGVTRYVAHLNVS